MPVNARSRRFRFVCVNDSVPEETTRLLREACRERDVEYVELAPAAFDFHPERQLVPGDLLYRPAVSLSAQRVEQFLFAPGVATFYDEPDGIYFACSNQPLRFQRHDISVVRSVYATSARQSVLDRQADFLGGFPVVVKYPGHSSGIGVFMIDSAAGLYSIVSYALAQGIIPLVMSYVGDATHWRVVVVGTRAVAAYRNPVDGDDFRTVGGTAAADFVSPVPDSLEQLAVRAVHAMRLEFGGVDVLEHVSGRLFVLESNFPCYHAHAELHGSVPVSGLMVDHLVEKSRRLGEAGDIDD